MGGLGAGGGCLYVERRLTVMAADVTSGLGVTVAVFKFCRCLGQFGRICPFS